LTSVHCYDGDLRAIIVLFQ